MIDREQSPATFSIAKFCTSSIALLFKLPVETVLRRGQVAILSTPEYVRALEGASQPSPTIGGKKLVSEELDTIVPVGKYNGVFGTMYSIVNEEGSHALPPSTTSARAKASQAASKRGKQGKQQPTIAETVYRRGQGAQGLWRGWKVSWWGLVGLWAAGVLGGGGDGEF